MSSKDKAPVVQQLVLTQKHLSQNGKAILATISTTHYLLSTSSKQRNKHNMVHKDHKAQHDMTWHDLSEHDMT